MTDRGLPIVDGAPACPFVAFEDDRDGRGQAPDHRHRCFAEPRPAPRALAHQEAYCLSSAFPVCPTFQDWARREAAAARPAADAAAADAREALDGQPLPPRDPEPYHAPEPETPSSIPPRRNPPRDWAAPPPWSAGDEPDRPEPGRGSFDVAPEAAPGWEAPQGPTGVAPGAGSGWQTTQEPAGAAAAGLAGSAAYRLAGPDPDEPLPARPASAGETGFGSYQQPDQQSQPGYGDQIGGHNRDDSGDAYGRYAQPDRSQRTGRSASRSAAQQARPAQVQVREPEDPSELFGPAWEHPRRYEAYPSLRTRVGLSGIGAPSRLGFFAIAVVLAAVGLFFVGPMLLGIGSNDGGSGATTVPSAAVTPTLAPTEPPAPTPQVYIVAKGDTISKIARKFGLTQEELLAANPQIKNPNKIQIGDEVTIPVPSASVVPDAGGEVSSAP